METGWEWKQTGWYVEPANARDVMTTIAAIGAYSSGQVFGWRGMSSVDYDLSSSLQRHFNRDVTEEQLRSAEELVLRAARDWGLGIQPTGQVDDLQLLADLQHYGIPTRLLDFTANPMTALWFACQSAPDAPRVAKAGVLIALNTTGWPVHYTVGGSDGLTWAQVGDPTGARLRTALAAGAPFRVESRVPNDRLRAQEGFFVAGPIAAPAPWVGEPPHQYRIEFVDPFRGIQLSSPTAIAISCLRTCLGHVFVARRGRSLLWLLGSSRV